MSPTSLSYIAALFSIAFLPSVSDRIKFYTFINMALLGVIKSFFE